MNTPEEITSLTQVVAKIRNWKEIASAAAGNFNLPVDEVVMTSCHKRDAVGKCRYVDEISGMTNSSVPMWAVMTHSLLDEEVLGFVWRTSPNLLDPGLQYITGVQCQAWKTRGVQAAGYIQQENIKRLGYTSLGISQLQAAANLLLKAFGCHRVVMRYFEVFRDLWMSLILNEPPKFSYDRLSVCLSFGKWEFQGPQMISLSYQTVLSCDGRHCGEFGIVYPIGWKRGRVGRIKSAGFGEHPSCCPSLWRDGESLDHASLKSIDDLIEESVQVDLVRGFDELVTLNPKAYVSRKKGCCDY